MRRQLTRPILAILLAAVVGAVMVGTSPVGARPSAPVEGTLAIDAGACASARPTGSYFRMIHPTGDRSGPFVTNGDSTCADATYTALQPGSDGGLVVGAHQPQPSPPFDDDGNSRANRIVQPVPFFGVLFSAATNRTDPQTGADTPAPRIEVDGDTLSGDLSSFGASWNDQHFNQGAPKPGGATPGLTSRPTGTLDRSTGRFVLEWTSQIEGGPFDNFTGLWHLEGTLRRAGDEPAPAAPAEGAQTPAPGAAAAAPTTVADGGPTTSQPDAADTATTTTVAGDEAPGDAVTSTIPADGIDDEQAIGATLSGGNEPAGWIVVAVALIGLAAIAAYVLSDRAIRRAELAVATGAVGAAASGGTPAAGTGATVVTPVTGAGAATAVRRARPSAIAVIAIGAGLALAPLVFQMFDRAPKGGDMIEDFEPYMTIEEIEAFRGHLGTIGAARDEVIALESEIGTEAATTGNVQAFQSGFPAIDDDMGSMLDTMEANIDNYEGVAALPPFPLFPWFFVLPGVMIAVVGVFALRKPEDRRPPTAAIVLGVCLIAAPVVFQMFTRAPGGADMIDEFESMMSTERVTEIQDYFLVIGAGEADLRRQVVPSWIDAGLATPEQVAATTEFGEQWPTISNEMAPMIGTMADNVDNFAAVLALPPFWLFPWFFVLPGVLLIAIGWLSRRALEPEADEQPDTGSLSESDEVTDPTDPDRTLEEVAT